MMESTQVIDVLRATLLPDQRRDSDTRLTELYNREGFAPSLLKVISEKGIELPVRQAAVICLKNMCVKFWSTGENKNAHIKFIIQEADKDCVRDHIVEALIPAPEPIRVQLAECVRLLAKFDYPERWSDLAQKASGYLMSDQKTTWMGALICIYQLAKLFSCKKSDDWCALSRAMNTLLPLCYQRMTYLMPDQSEDSVLLQKQILKIFHELVKHFLPLKLITPKMLSEWIDVILQVAGRSIPHDTDEVDEHDRPQLAWWKTKKWALRNLVSLNDNYDRKGAATSEYIMFYQWYLRQFSGRIICILLKVLYEYRAKQYVSPRVLLYTINHLKMIVLDGRSREHIFKHMVIIIKDVIFPLMCPNNDDADLWQNDPLEYTRARLDMTDLHSPMIAAQQLLYTTLFKSNELFNMTMEFIKRVLSEASLTPQQKTGALYMMRTIANILCVQDSFEHQHQAEDLLVNYVSREVHSNYGYIRATTCWVISAFLELPFNDITKHLGATLQLLLEVLGKDKEQMVRIQATHAILNILTFQPQVKDILRVHVRNIIIYVLDIIRQTNQFDLIDVIGNLVTKYKNDIVPVIVDLCVQLAQTFGKLMESSEETNNKVIATKSLLATLDTIVHVVKNNSYILIHFEGIILDIVDFISGNNVDNLYDEMFSLLRVLTAVHISPRMRQTLHKCEFFKSISVINLHDVLPILYNYVTVDLQGFTSNPRNMEIVDDVCKMVLSGNAYEKAKCDAAKLLEIVLLQYKGQVDPIVPSICQLVAQLLMMNVKSPTLRISYLQVLIAALYYNPPLVLDLFNELPTPDSSETFTDIFIFQWFKNINCFPGIHGRKLCVLGLCCLLEVPPELRPPCLLEYDYILIPSVIKLLKGIQMRYVIAASLDRYCTSLSARSGDFESYELPGLDEVVAQTMCSFITEDASEQDDIVLVESFKTPLDDEDCSVNEFQVFNGVLQVLQQKDPLWCSFLASTLTQREQNELQVIFQLAEQQQAITAAMTTLYDNIHSS